MTHIKSSYFGLALLLALSLKVDSLVPSFSLINNAEAASTSSNSGKVQGVSKQKTSRNKNKKKRKLGRSTLGGQISCALPANLTQAEKKLKWIPISSQADLEQIRQNPSGNFFLCQNITLKPIAIPTGQRLKSIAIPEIGQSDRGVRELTHIPLPVPKNDFEKLLMGWPPNWAFKGIFDGNGKTIIGLSTPRFVIEHDYGYREEAAIDRAGLFYIIDTTGVVRNLRVQNPKMIVDMTSGVIAGQNLGKILNVSVVGSGFIKQAVKSRNVSTVGALVGANYGTIENSSVGNEFSVIGYDMVGGITGSCMPWRNSRPIIKNSVFRGKLSHEGPFSQIFWDFGGIVGLSSGCLLQSVYASGPIQGMAHTGGLIGRIVQSSTIENSTVDGAVIGSRSVGGLVGAVQEEDKLYDIYGPISGEGVRIIRSSFTGSLVGAADRDDDTPPPYKGAALGGLIGSIKKVDKTAAQNPSHLILLKPISIRLSYANGTFALASQDGPTSHPSVNAPQPLNSVCGGLIGFAEHSRLVGIGTSYADMKPAQWAFETEQNNPGIEQFPLLIMNPSVRKLGLMGGTCDQLGGISGEGEIVPFGTVFNKENLPYEHFRLDGPFGKQYGLFPGTYESLLQFLKKPSGVERAFGVSQKEMLSIDTYRGLYWNIAPAQRKTSSRPDWIFEEGSYPFLNY